MDSEDSSYPRKICDESDGLLNFSSSSNSSSKDDAHENDFDLFDDIIIDKEKERTNQIVEESSKKLKVTESNLKKYQEENENLKKDNITLMKNISSLWRTACIQLKQKSIFIAKLTRENESLKFQSGIQRLSKDEFDRAVSRIAAYDKEEFKNFMKEFQDSQNKFKRSYNEHIKERPLRPKVNIRASVRGARILANNSDDSIRLQKLLGRKSGSITRHVIKDFESRRIGNSYIARNGNKQNSRHRSSKKIISGHHSIYSKINDVEENVCELKSEECSTKNSRRGKRSSRSEENYEYEIGDKNVSLNDYEDEIILLNENKDSVIENLGSKIISLNSIKEKGISLSKMEGNCEDEFRYKFKISQEDRGGGTKEGEFDNGNKLQAVCLESALTYDFVKGNRHSTDTHCNILCDDDRNESAEMDSSVTNKVAIGTEKSNVDKFAIDSVVKNIEINSVSVTRDEPMLNNVKTVSIPDQSRNIDSSSLTIQTNEKSKALDIHCHDKSEANLDLYKEPFKKRFKDFVPEKTIDSLSNSDLRTYKIPKKALRERVVNVDNHLGILLKLGSSKTNLYNEETSVSRQSATNIGRRSDNCMESPLSKRNEEQLKSGKDGHSKRDRKFPNLNYKERSKSKEDDRQSRNLNYKERSKSKEDDRKSPNLNYKERSKSKEGDGKSPNLSKPKENKGTQSLKSGTESSSKHDSNRDRRNEIYKFSKMCTSSQRDQNWERKLTSQTHRERKLSCRSTNNSERHSFDRKKCPLSLTPDRNDALIDKNKSSKKRSHSPRKSLYSKNIDCYGSKNKFHQSSVHRNERTRLSLQSGERSRPLSDRRQYQNRQMVDKSNLRKHSSISADLPDEFEKTSYPRRKSLKSPQDLCRETRIRKDAKSHSHQSKSLSLKKNYIKAEREKGSHSLNRDTDDIHKIKSVEKSNQMQNSKSPRSQSKDSYIRSISAEERSHSHKIKSRSQEKNSNILEEKVSQLLRQDTSKLKIISHECAFPQGRSEQPSSRVSNVEKKGKSQKYLINSSSSKHRDKNNFKTKCDNGDNDNQTDAHITEFSDTTTVETNQKSREISDAWQTKELIKKLRDRRLKSNKYLSVSRQPSKNIYKLRRMRKEGMESSFFRNCDKIKRSVRKYKLSSLDSQEKVSTNETEDNNENSQIRDTFECDDTLKMLSHECYNLSPQIQSHSQDTNRPMLQYTPIRRKLKAAHEDREPGEISSSDDDTTLNPVGNVVPTKISDSNQGVYKQLMSFDEIALDDHISLNIIESPYVSNYDSPLPLNLSTRKNADNSHENFSNKHPDQNSGSVPCTQHNCSTGKKAEELGNQCGINDGLLKELKQYYFPLSSKEESSKAKWDTNKVTNCTSDFSSIRSDLIKSPSLASSGGKLMIDLLAVPLKKIVTDSSSILGKEFDQKKCVEENNSAVAQSVDDCFPAKLAKLQIQDKVNISLGRTELESLSHIRNCSKDAIKDLNHGTELNYSASSSYKDKYSFQEEDTIDQILKRNVVDSNQLHSDDSETSLLQFLGTKETPEKTQDNLISVTPPPFVQPVSPTELSSLSGNISHNLVQSCPAHKMEYLKSIIGINQVSKKELNLQTVSSIMNEAPQYVSTVVPSVDFSYNNCLKLNSPLVQTKVLPLVNTPSPKTLTTSSCSPIAVATPLNNCIDSASSCTPPSVNASLKSSTPIVIFDLNRKSKFPRETLPSLVQKVVDERNRSKSCDPFEKSDVHCDQQKIVLPYQITIANSSSEKDDIDVNSADGVKDCNRPRSNSNSDHSLSVIAVKEFDKSPIENNSVSSSVDASEKLTTENSEPSTGLTLSKGTLRKKVPFTTISHIIDKSNSTLYDFGLQNKEESSFVSSFSRKVDDIEDSLLGNTEFNHTGQNKLKLSKERCVDSNSDSSSSSSSSSSSCSSNCSCGGCNASSSSSSCSTCSSGTNSASHASLLGQAQSFTDCNKASISPSADSDSPSKRLSKNSNCDSKSLKSSNLCSNSDEQPFQQNVELIAEKNVRANAGSNCVNPENLRKDGQSTCKFSLENSNAKVVGATAHMSSSPSFLNVLKESGTSKAGDESIYVMKKDKNIKDVSSLSDGVSQPHSKLDFSFSNDGTSRDKRISMDPNSCSTTKVILVRKKKVCLTPSSIQRTSTTITATTKSNIGYSKPTSVSVISIRHEENDHILRDVTLQSSNEHSDRNKIAGDSNSTVKVSDQRSSVISISHSTSKPLQENLCEANSSCQNVEASNKGTLSFEPLQQVVFVKKKAKRRKVVLSMN